ncbi:MAG: hypothetical protein GKR97_12325 [Rhizobiaceae bacterium]|nr:hypothetical protein [Rhizobiaceae bacterium]
MRQDKIRTTRTHTHYTKGKTKRDSVMAHTYYGKQQWLICDEGELQGQSNKGPLFPAAPVQ